MRTFTVEKLDTSWIIRKDHDIIGVASSFGELVDILECLK
jgi:hypothetical protein|nr:MAG TPA: hypothetical protein [Caudoviricetes sp.]